MNVVDLEVLVLRAYSLMYRFGRKISPQLLSLTYECGSFGQAVVL
jgi:hypothetical protein